MTKDVCGVITTHLLVLEVVLDDHNCATAGGAACAEVCLHESRQQSADEPAPSPPPWIHARHDRSPLQLATSYQYISFHV